MYKKKYFKKTTITQGVKELWLLLERPAFECANYDEKHIYAIIKRSPHRVIKADTEEEADTIRHAAWHRVKTELSCQESIRDFAKTMTRIAHSFKTNIKTKTENENSTQTFE